MMHLTKIFLALLLCFLVTGKIYAQTPSPLLSDLDIPLMAGFQETEDSRVVFDTPSGRIIEVQATGRHRAEQVLDYYRIVLPSLAWKYYGKDSEKCENTAEFCLKYHRDGEVLSLKMVEAGQHKNQTTIYFSVNPE